jgi:hypothetical protein
MSEQRTFVVDRIENDHAVLIGDDRTEYTLPRAHIPAGAGEGTVLKVRVEGDAPDWTSAIADAAEQSRRVEEAKQRMDALKKSDPGGNLKL